LPALVAQTGDDGHVLAHGFERLDDEREVEITADLRRLPLFLKRPVREVHETQTRTGLGGGLRERRACRNHRIEQRKRDGCAGAFQNLTTRNMFAGQERHTRAPRSGTQYLVLGAWSVLSPWSVPGAWSLVRGPRTTDGRRTKDRPGTKHQVLS